MYRTVDSKFWTDPAITSLSPQGKLLALYLFTNPHTHLGGIYYILRSTINEETGIQDRVSAPILDRLFHSSFAEYDEKRSIIWVKNMFQYQARGRKNEIAVANHLASLHDSPLIDSFLSKYPQVSKHVKRKEKEIRDHDGQQQDRVSTSKPPCPLDQDQDQDQKKEQKKRPSVAVVIPDCINTVQFQAAWTLWMLHRQEIGKPLKPTGTAALLKKLAGMGTAKAIAAIENSLANGWQGIFLPRNGQTEAEPPRPPTADEKAHGEWNSTVGWRFDIKTCKDSACPKPKCVAAREAVNG